jgi:hypothetical protein
VNNHGLLTVLAFVASLATPVILNAREAIPATDIRGPNGRLLPRDNDAPSSTACPRGNSYPADGCANTKGSVQYPDLLTNKSYGPGSGQTYAKRAPWNIAGLDYAVGVPAGTKLKDPALIQPINCRYSPNGSAAHGPKITCGGHNLAIIGYEFGPIGGHPSTVLQISGNATGRATVENNHFLNDTNTDRSSAVYDYWINFGIGGTEDIEFKNNTLDGNYTPGLITSGGIPFYTRGALTIEYNAVLNMPQRPFAAGCEGCTTIGDLTVKWNLFLGFSNVAGGLHGEIMQQVFSQTNQTTQAHTTYQYNTIVNPNTTAIGQTTSFIVISGGGAPVGPPIYQDVLVDSNTLVNNKNGGRPTSASLIYFSNGIYQHIKITNNFTDSTGTYGTNEVLGIQSDFTGYIDAGTGNLHVTAVSSTSAPIMVGQLLWIRGAASGITVGPQQNGAPAGVGTYSTSGTTAAVGSQKMIGYGTKGDAVIVVVPIMFGNIDMISGEERNKFDYADHIHVPL